ncbi:hypothetical protein BSR28_00940 [Boudabousia liubingyangii]|uniref:hypothetical protein n=1 Tax=Boudabousia liubingyangii TaxID=1921764 RepID=UPI00093EA69A|nr:hypothetical protein [Boudabousia liubingyangii]OKL48302.1 hypothetical protein BSR28_00940 [Boudabousia liubingyangii]
MRMTRKGAALALTFPLVFGLGACSSAADEAKTPESGTSKTVSATPSPNPSEETVKPPQSQSVPLTPEGTAEPGSGSSPAGTPAPGTGQPASFDLELNPKDPIVEGFQDGQVPLAFDAKLKELAQKHKCESDSVAIGSTTFITWSLNCADLNELEALAKELAAQPEIDHVTPGVRMSNR